MTAATFFLLEIGDKTQFATIALAAKYGSLLAVVAGTTVGILLADIPVVLLSSAAAGQFPLKSVHKFATHGAAIQATPQYRSRTFTARARMRRCCASRTTSRD